MSAPLSLFWGFVLYGESRERDSGSSAVFVFSSPIADPSALFSVQQKQFSGTGCPSRFKVWVWNSGAWANRFLMAVCRITFFCSGGPSSEAASKQTGFKQIGLNQVLLISGTKNCKPAPFCFFSLSCLLRADTSACSVSIRRSLSSTRRQAFCTNRNSNPEVGRCNSNVNHPRLTTHLQLWLQRVVHFVDFVNLSQKPVGGEEAWAVNYRWDKKKDLLSVLSF